MTFKSLTLATWQEPDPVNSVFGRFDRLAGPRQMTGEDWAREFLAVELEDHVPEHIRELFAVARGAMLYGWFFYPMFLMGEQQMYRVVEAAATTRYQQLQGPKGKPTFKQTVEWLIERQVIPAEDEDRWDAVRQLRNAASHPDRQSVMPPGAVLSGLKASADDINDLFATDPFGAGLRPESQDDPSSTTGVDAV
jgi:hypothetical protein